MSQKALASGSPCPPLPKGQLRLYSMRFCPFAQRVRLLLDLKEVQYETININLKSKPEWFLKKNPEGKVPVLEKDGMILYESLVVSEYVDKVYTQQPVIPTDPSRKALDDMFITAYGNKFIPNYYKILRSQGKDAEASKGFMTSLQMLEDELTNRNSKFYGGEKAAFVDFMIWPWLERLPLFNHYDPSITPDSFPGVQKWCEAMLALPAVQKCFFPIETHMEVYKSFFDKPDDSVFDIGLPA